MALLLTGCDSDGASFLINGNSQAVSVVRHRAHPWAQWELAVVVRNDPGCQRRHRLKDVTSGTAQIDLFQPAPGAYILRQGKRWYVVELASCGFETFKEEPQLPGQLLGVFQTKAGKFVFESEAQDGAAAKGKTRAAGG